MKIREWITNNLGLKVVSLVLAVATWFYITAELRKNREEEERAIVNMLRYDVVSKRLPIQLTLVGNLQEGYHIDTEGVTVTPPRCLVIGPKHILENVSTARTVPVDISEYTRDITREVEIAPLAKGIRPQSVFVTVFIPIEKTSEHTRETKSP